MIPGNREILDRTQCSKAWHSYARRSTASLGTATGGCLCLTLAWRPGAVLYQPCQSPPRIPLKRTAYGETWNPQAYLPAMYPVGTAWETSDGASSNLLHYSSPPRTVILRYRVRFSHGVAALKTPNEHGAKTRERCKYSRSVWKRFEAKHHTPPPDVQVRSVDKRWYWNIRGGGYNTRSDKAHP